MPRGEHRTTNLLSREENEQVFSLIGPKCQSLATTVVQLFTTEGPAHSEWKKRDTGVLCLIKDNGKRSYFFRIYCLYRKAMIWEHEVYMQIEYKNPRPYLHTFEAEEYMTAFNFANEEEAQILKKILIEKIELRKTRREERRQRALTAARANSVVEPRQNGVLPPLPAPEPEPAPVLPPKTNLAGTYTLKSSGKRKTTRKLTKADIGMPHNFTHVSHIGWDKDKGFDVETTQDEKLLSFLKEAGVSEVHLRDQETRKFIYSFIETNGGINAVMEDLHTNNEKPIKERSAPSRAPAPPVPQRSPALPHPPAPRTYSTPRHVQTFT